MAEAHRLVIVNDPHMGKDDLRSHVACARVPTDLQFKENIILTNNTSGYGISVFTKHQHSWKNYPSTVNEVQESANYVNEVNEMAKARGIKDTGLKTYVKFNGQVGHTAVCYKIKMEHLKRDLPWPWTVQQSGRNHEHYSICPTNSVGVSETPVPAATANYCFLHVPTVGELGWQPCSVVHIAANAEVIDKGNIDKFAEGVLSALAEDYTAEAEEVMNELNKMNVLSRNLLLSPPLASMISSMCNVNSEIINIRRLLIFYGQRYSSVDG